MFVLDCVLSSNKNIILARNFFKCVYVADSDVIEHLRKREENNVRLRHVVIYSSVLAHWKGTRLLNSLKPAE